MRTISPAGLAKLAQKLGNEPILLLEVDWATSLLPKWYGDRTVSSIPGRILEIGNLDNVVGISANNTSQEINVTLDDTDGSIKAILNAHDIHKRTARLYQWFEGLDLGDKFLLFSGKISSPCVWNERERTVNFSIVSQLEDKEVGFSPEEGQFTWLPAGMVGKPWPLIFGTVLDCPALQMNEAVSGTTLAGVGVIAGLSYLSSMPLFSDGGSSDSSTFVSLAQIAAQISTLWCAYNAYGGWSSEKAHEYLDQINELERQRFEIVYNARAQAACASWQREKQIQEATSRGLGANPLRILGGEDFPQNTTLTIEINGAYFVGRFSGQNFYISTRSWPEGESEALNQKEDRDETCSYSLPPGGHVTKYDYRIDVPCGYGNHFLGDNCLCRFHGYIIQTGKGRSSRISDDPIPQQFWAEPGAQVRIYSSEPITYIVAAAYVSPGTVLAVKAYKEFTGERRLVDVPSSYYTIKNVTYGAIHTVQIVTNKPLSSYKDQGYTDDLYVTFRSNIGPDIIDILEYIIEWYTDLTCDPVSFAAVQLKLDPNQNHTGFVANFPILDRKNAVEVLQDIAFQARCALWISNGVVYLKYLPEEPASVDTITESDIDAETGVKVDLTSTEDIVTKMRIKWRMSWSPGITDREKDKSEKTIILRHNVSRYGIQEEEYDFYIYNQPDSIYKASTFWLIRKSNTWKRISFSTFLHKLALETFDCVTLDFDQPYVATGPIKAIVEEATYNSGTNRIDFVCLVPVKSGQMTKYQWFWPAGLPITLTWPPPDEIAAGDAGGGGTGMGTGGDLPIGYFEDWGDDIVIVGGPNVVFRPQSDWGDRRPTDVGYQAQSIGVLQNYAEVTSGPKPRLNLRTFMAEPTNPSGPPELPKGFFIDIAKTKVVDSTDGPPQRSAVFKSVFRGINQNRELTIDVNAKVADDEHLDGIACLADVVMIGDASGYLCLRSDVYIWDANGVDPEVSYDFKYASDYDVWAAGTAFLRDN